MQVELQLGPDLATNNQSMYVQLMGAPWIEPVGFSLRGPFAAQTRALVSAKCGPRYPSASIDIVAKSTCDSCELVAHSGSTCLCSLKLGISSERTGLAS